MAQLADGNYHACLWRGTAASFVDLNPPGLISSRLYGVDESQQVGIATVNGAIHAAYWSGTARSFVDLHAVLPDNYSESDALAVWTDGLRTLVVGQAINRTTNATEAVLWKLTPPPVPTVAISGKKKVFTTRARFTIRGYAFELGGTLARVEVQVGKQGFRPAIGAANWQVTARLKPGRNAVLARAIDTSGVPSPTAQAVIIRR
jgi:hypothetical protein